MESNKTGMKERGEKIWKEREGGGGKGGRDKAKIPGGELEGMQIEAEAHNEGKLGFYVLPLRQ